MRKATIRIQSLALLVSALGFLGACESDSTGPESSSGARQKITYGSDDRQEIGELTDARQIAWANATGTFFDDVDVNCSAGSCALTTKPYGDSLGGLYIPACAGEPYIGQPEGGHCTGFLIAPDLVVSAGHCFVNQYDCDHLPLVFGFAVDASGQAPTTVPETDVYRCKELVAHAVTYNSSNGLGDVDFTLLRLDRPVVGRTPLAIRRSGIVADDAELATIGSPLGLPLKYAPGATLRSNVPTNRKFALNLDASKGNSGAPVIDVRTGLVEGIVSAGPANEWVFEQQPDGTTCSRTLHCDDVSGCAGAMPWVHASRIMSVVEVLEGRSCYDGIRNAHESDVDCGGSDCDPCFMGKACQQVSDCYQFPYDCRAAVCNEDHQCAESYASCQCQADSDCEDGLACTTNYCGSYMCQEISNTCECTVDTDCNDNTACTRDTCSPTTRTCVHDASACEPQCTEATAIDMGSPSNVVTVPNNGCLRVRDQYPSWWATRTMQLMTWDRGTYPVPYTWSNTCAASSGSGRFTGNWQSQFLNTTSAACATLIDLKGDGSGNVSLVYY
jgi:hypothetical protein